MHRLQWRRGQRVEEVPGTAKREPSSWSTPEGGRRRRREKLMEGGKEERREGSREGGIRRYIYI